MSETKRTVALVVLLCITIGFIWWTRYNYQVNFEAGL